MTHHHTSPVPHAAKALQGKPAGLVSRSVASVIDAAVVAAALTTLYAAITAALFVWNPRGFDLPSWSGVVSLTSAWVVAIVYLTVGWWTAGRTCGCAVMGLRVVDRRGRGLKFVPALLRAVVCTFFPLGLVWCAVDVRARAVHDLAVRSRVVYDWRHREP